MAGGGDEALGFLSYFQALALVMEGTYTAGDARDNDPPKRRPPFYKPHSTPPGKKGGKGNNGASFGQVIGALKGNAARQPIRMASN
jgi:hypothetical protein